MTITDNSTAGTTTVVADGVAHSFNKQFADFELDLVGTKDALTFDLAGAYVGRHVSVLAKQ